MSSSDNPPGDLVSSIPALAPKPLVLRGKHCTLTPLALEHAPDLFTNLSGLGDDSLWRYLPTGPYSDLDQFTENIKFLCQGSPFFAFAIFSPNPKYASNKTRSTDSDSRGIPVGIITYLNIVPVHRSIEIGHVLFAKTLQRTTEATDSIYLLMKHAFDDLHYQRVEWKANNLNEPSKRAALRLGFVFEGVFRKHMVVKGRSRDSAWYSVTDDEWKGGVQAALHNWLDEANFDVEGRQKTKLEDFRHSSKDYVLVQGRGV